MRVLLIGGNGFIGPSVGPIKFFKKDSSVPSDSCPPFPPCFRFMVLTLGVAYREGFEDGCGSGTAECATAVLSYSA